MKKQKRTNVFNKEFKEELNDLQDGSDMFESDMDLNGDDDKKQFNDINNAYFYGLC